VTTDVGRVNYQTVRMYTGVVGRYTGLDPVPGALVDRHPPRIPVISGVYNGSLLVIHISGNGIFGLFRTSPQRQVVNLYGPLPEDLILPIDPLHVAIVFK